VRCGRHADIAIELQHGVEGAVAGGATGTVGAGEEIRVVAGQLAGHAHQLLVTGLGLGGEELETVATFLRHKSGPCRREEGGALPPRLPGASVAVGVRLERAFDGNADVVGLLLGQLGDDATEALDHFQGDFLV